MFRIFLLTFTAALIGCAAPPALVSDKSYVAPTADKPSASMTFGTEFEGSQLVTFHFNTENPDDNCTGKFDMLRTPLRKGILFFSDQDVPETKLVANQPISIMASQVRGTWRCQPPPLKFIPQAGAAYRLTIRPYSTGRGLGGCALALKQVSPSPGTEIASVTYVPFCTKKP